MHRSPLIGLSDRSMDDLHSSVPACAAKRGPESKTCCLAVGIWWATTLPGRPNGLTANGLGFWISSVH
jgi:hypothetical protein